MKKMFAIIATACAFFAVMTASGASIGEVYSNKADSKAKDIYGSGSSLLVGNRPYDSLATAKAAMNLMAKEKYGELYPDTPIADAQSLSELAGYIIGRKNPDGTESFYITGLQKLGGSGGDRGALGGHKIGDSVYGYHTGRHTTEDGLTIPSSKDYKSLRLSAEKWWEKWELEIVDDMATGKSAAIDKAGGVWSFSENGDLTKESDSVAAYCNKKSGEFENGYERTKAHLANKDKGDSDGHSAACVKDADSLVVNGSAALGSTGHNPAPANQTYTQDNRQVKQWAADQIKSAYSQATAIADSEGFGGEYRARVDPIVNQGLNAINSIPDQQTVTVPAAPTQGGGSPNGQ